MRAFTTPQSILTSLEERKCLVKFMHISTASKKMYIFFGGESPSFLNFFTPFVHGEARKDGTRPVSLRPEQVGLSLIAITNRQIPFSVLQDYKYVTRDCLTIPLSCTSQFESDSSLSDAAVNFLG